MLLSGAEISKLTLELNGFLVNLLTLHYVKSDGRVMYSTEMCMINTFTQAFSTVFLLH